MQLPLEKPVPPPQQDTLTREEMFPVRGERRKDETANVGSLLDGALALLIASEPTQHSTNTVPTTTEPTTTVPSTTVPRTVPPTMDAPLMPSFSSASTSLPSPVPTTTPRQHNHGLWLPSSLDSPLLPEDSSRNSSRSSNSEGVAVYSPQADNSKKNKRHQNRPLAGILPIDAYMAATDAKIQLERKRLSDYKKEKR